MSYSEHNNYDNEQEDMDSRLTPKIVMRKVIDPIMTVELKRKAMFNAYALKKNEMKKLKNYESSHPSNINNRRIPSLAPVRPPPTLKTYTNAKGCVIGGRFQAPPPIEVIVLFFIIFDLFKHI